MLGGNEISSPQAARRLTFTYMPDLSTIHAANLDDPGRW
jgi:hypothetical protein